MRCLSHFFIFKTEKCFKNFHKDMKTTRICYYCVRELKKMKKIDTAKDLIKNDFYKNFISFDQDILQTSHKSQLNPQL
jgi:hypothetical protein